jgi:hypothetical protein
MTSVVEIPKVLQAPVIREARFQDYDQIAALEARYGLETKSNEEWRHLWVNNPAYKRSPNTWPIGWVLEGVDQKIYGYLGNVPLAYEFDGRRLTAATSRAWVVDASYRSFSLLLVERFFAQKHVDIFLNTTVNAEASKGYAVFRASRVPVGEWDRSSFWVTNYPGFVASWLKMKSVPLGKTLIYPLSMGLFLRDRARQKSWQCERNVSVRNCESFDDRFDEFWQQLRVINSKVLLAVRSREILEWHFKYALRQRKVLVLRVEEKDQPIAYAVFCRQDSSRYGLSRLRLIDFQSLDRSADLLKPMLSRALKFCRDEGIHMLENIGLTPEKSKLFRQFAPYHRQLPSWLYFYRTKNKDLVESLKDPEVWDPSCFDGDTSL